MKNVELENKNVVINEIDLIRRLSEELENIPAADMKFGDRTVWGDKGELFTPAYWKVQYLLHDDHEGFNINYSLGTNILEEAVACLLGGFGLKSELGLLAYKRLKHKELIIPGVSYQDLLVSLETPFLLNGKYVRYRFPNQKAKYIYGLLNKEDLHEIPVSNDLELRNWLLSVKGIGMKTASWITRNYLDSKNVAIVDIHIYRACKIMGLFEKSYDIQKDYIKLEEIFLSFCEELNVDPSKMDALMWLHMKHTNRMAINLIKNS